jgi:hypothetical protein
MPAIADVEDHRPSVPVPRSTCLSCGEYWPHSCAPLMFRRRTSNWRGAPKTLIILDREPEPVPTDEMPPDTWATS